MRVDKRNIENHFADGEWHSAGEIAAHSGVTRQTAHRHLSRLVDEQRLVVSGAGRGTRYRRRSEGFSRTFETSGLDEALLWEELSLPGTFLGTLPDNAGSTLAYAFTELVNNVIDHSGAAEVEIKVEQDGSVVELEVNDSGTGVFIHIRNRMNLESELEALQELSKGKTTTMPDRHTGEGIFFTSKAVHIFEIRSGSLRWIIDNRRQDTAVGESDPPVNGTRVRLEVDVNDVRNLTEVFAEYSTGIDFDRTRTVIRLFSIGTKFLSRSEAKRLLHGLDKFREVVLDFKGVDLVGQGFADEVFRVWARLHPKTRLIATDMSSPIEFMVERAIRNARLDQQPAGD